MGVAPQREPEMLLGEAVERVAAEIGREHRAVEGHQVRARVGRHVERGEVAEADEGLAARRHAIPVDTMQDAREPVAAARRHDEIDRVVREQRMKAVHALLVGAGEIAPGLQRLAGHDDAVAEVAQVLLALAQRRLVGRSGKPADADRRRLGHRARQARSLAPHRVHRRRFSHRVRAAARTR
jgi:hypothetical protein